MKPIRLLYHFHVDGRANSHVPDSLAAGMRVSGADTMVYCPSAGEGAQSKTHPAAKGLAMRLVYRIGGLAWLQQRSQAAFLKDLTPIAPDTLAYLWAGIPLRVHQRLHEAGVPVVLERINCPRATAKPILQAAYDAMGLPAPQDMDSRSLEEEAAKLELANAVFCPSPKVLEAVRALGIPNDKCLATSYGWSPARFPKAGAPKSPGGPVTFLFVGSIGVRKGVPLLLEAWRRLAPDPAKARLVLQGKVDADYAHRFAKAMALPGVTQAGYNSDMSTVYAGAHAFVFPSLEEGSPLVIYEAMAHGVVPIVSPMGAGAVVQDAVHGIVLSEQISLWPSQWSDDLATRMARVLEAPDWLQAMSRSARERAQVFTWDKVAARRLMQLEEAFP